MIQNFSELGIATDDLTERNLRPASKQGSPCPIRSQCRICANMRQEDLVKAGRLKILRLSELS
jgi:hypothetical protein